MKILIRSRTMTGEGTAPDDATTMDARYAVLLFGVECFEVLADGSRGRSIDPMRVKMDQPWPSLAEHQKAADDARSGAKHAYETWLGADPCEAASWRDPGQASR